MNQGNWQSQGFCQGKIEAGNEELPVENDYCENYQNRYRKHGDQGA
jgi:hypothetical protein